MKRFPLLWPSCLASIPVRLVSSYRQGGCVPAGWCSAGGDHIKRRIYKICFCICDVIRLFRHRADGRLFPGLCGAAEELGFRSADVAEIGKLFYNLTTQDDAQNYARIAGYGLPVYQLLADITGEKVSKIKADIDSRIVDDAKVAQVLFMALEDTYAEKSKEITQAEMTQISGVILTEFQDAAVGKVVFIDPNGTVIREIG